MQKTASADVFCTICTADSVSCARTLYASINKFVPDIPFYCLVIDAAPGSENNGNFHFRSPADIWDGDGCREVFLKHRGDTFTLGLCLKPVLLSWLIRTGCKRAVYLDINMFCVSSPAAVFEEMADYRFFLCPQWRSISPRGEHWNFKKNYLEGIYNAGFAGAGAESEEILRWWRSRISACSRQEPQNGFWHDQRYLDAVPALFDGIGITRNMGIGISTWNQCDCLRTVHEGTVRINRKWQPVFLHMNPVMRHEIYSRQDPLLLPFLIDYDNNLSSFREI